MNQPLLLPPAAQAQQQPKIEVGLKIDENGVTLRIPISPITFLEQTIPEDMMNQLCAQWLETRREVKRMQTLAQDAIRTKR